MSIEPAENEAWFWSLVDQSRGQDACWPWTGKRTGRGYGSLHFELCGMRKVFGTHVIAHVLGNGGQPSSKALQTAILHACDNPPCCNPKHLSFGTASDNQRDCIRKGRRDHVVACRGEAVGLAKLTEPQVLEIRRRWAARETQDALAAEFGVARNAVFMIVRGITWRHLPVTERCAPLQFCAEPLGRQPRGMF